MKRYERGKWQLPIPARKPSPADGYDIYPAFRLGDGLIHAGYRSLAERILPHGTVILDGYAGVFWSRLEDEIMAAAAEKGIRARWIQTDRFLKSENVIREMTAPARGPGMSRP